MNPLAAIAITAATIILMEIGAYLLHRYVMHGWGWGWHRSHHEEREGWFELNDLFGVVFALISIALFALGIWYPVLTWIALGMTLYGVLYFVFHDGLVHQRWPFRHVPRRGYAKRLYQAHRLHHAVHERDGAVSFGFLYAKPVEDLTEELSRSGTVRKAGKDQPSAR